METPVGLAKPLHVPVTIKIPSLFVFRIEGYIYKQIYKQQFNTILIIRTRITVADPGGGDDRGHHPPLNFSRY